MPPKWIEGLDIVVKESRCRSEVLKKLGLSHKSSGNHQTFDRWATRLGIDTSHFNYREVLREQLTDFSFKRRISYDDVFCENSNVTQSLVRKRFKEIKQQLCEECSVSDLYNEKPIVLQLDHINGIRNDNRLENLRWLCPNCHSQTITWSNKKRVSPKIYNRIDNIINSKNYKKFKIDWPEIENLYMRVRIEGYSAVGKTLGVSGNAVKKHLIKNGLIIPRYNIKDSNSSGGTWHCEKER